jgi:NitT/TauT family transport system substrate-binding protein
MGWVNNHAGITWRTKIANLLRLALFGLWLVSPIPHAQSLLKITLASPGPASFSYLPIDLIKKIGADQAEGVDLDIRYFGGGPLAANEMLKGNSDFAALGMAALAGIHADGKDVRSLVSISRAPTYVLSVRSELRPHIKSIADLKGRVIGVHSSGKTSKSTSRQLVEFMLHRAGVSPDSVNYLSAGQSYAEQRAALASGAIDALMGEEPFSTRLAEEGLAFILADLHNEGIARQALGGPFLYVQIATRGNLLEQQPEKARRMVAIMRRVLLWIANHNADEVARMLSGPDPELIRESRQLLARSKSAFSPDGTFRRQEVATTERFFLGLSKDNPILRGMRLTDFIDARYAGWKE